LFNRNGTTFTADRLVLCVLYTPEMHWESLQHSTDRPLAGFKGPLRGEGKKTENGKEEGKVGKGKGYQGKVGEKTFLKINSCLVVAAVPTRVLIRLWHE